MKNTLKHQISLRVLLVFVINAILFGGILFLFERNRYQMNLRKIEVSLNAVVQNKVSHLGNMIYFQNLVGLESSMGNLLEFHGVVGAEIYDSLGNPYYASYRPFNGETFSMEEYSREGYEISQERFQGIRTLVYTAPLNVVGDFYGYARFFYSLEELNRQLVFAALLFLSILVALLAGILVIIYVILKKKVTQPVEKISRTMEALGAGELGEQVEIQAQNELGLIADSFNQMSRENARMYKKLQDVNASLEKKVVHRTKELQQSQDLLESVLNSSIDGIMVLKSVLSKEGNVEDFQWVMANPRATANFASEVGEILGKKITASFPSFREDELFQDFRRAATNQDPFQKDCYLEFANLRGWFRISTAVIDQGLAVTFHDITPSKQLQQDLEKQAQQDGLTRISNRTYFDDFLREHWCLCLEERQPLSLLFIDVDFFKNYNDRYGHIEGDKCLIAIADVLNRTASRPLDCAARYGGEEFVVLLPRTSQEGAENKANCIIRDIESLQIPHSSSTVSPFVTVSIGVVSMFPNKQDGISYIVERADKALYQAKEKGRNRYVVDED